MEWTWSISELPFILLFIGALIGLILGLTGSGGSLVAVPLLVVLLSLELSEAIGISLAVVSFSAAIGVFHHFKSGDLNIRQINCCAIDISIDIGSTIYVPKPLEFRGLCLNV